MTDLAGGPTGLREPEASINRAPRGPKPISRRRFIGYLIAAPTVMGAAQLFVGPANASIPTTSRSISTT